MWAKARSLKCSKAHSSQNGRQSSVCRNGWLPNTIPFFYKILNIKIFQSKYWMLHGSKQVIITAKVKVAHSPGIWTWRQAWTLNTTRRFDFTFPMTFTLSTHSLKRQFETKEDLSSYDTQQNSLSIFLIAWFIHGIVDHASLLSHLIIREFPWYYGNHSRLFFFRYSIQACLIQSSLSHWLAAYLNHSMWRKVKTWIYISTKGIYAKVNTAC